MAGGSWNGGGDKPAHPTAWCKITCGWVNPTVIFNTAQAVTVRPYKDNKDIFKLPVGNVNSKEYFLISNRRKTGFDGLLPGEGLVVEHIDENKTGNTDENHYLVDIVQADGLRQLNINANSGDAQDVFPTASNNQVTAASNPSSKAYDGTDSKIAITEITRSGDNITAKVNVGGVAVSNWVNNVKVLQVFASPHSTNAWANIGSVGWRKIDELAKDGVTNVFIACCQARISGGPVTVLVDANKIHQLYY
jgi:immune inhibitor A